MGEQAASAPAEDGSRKPAIRKGTIGIVIAGAAARGPFEAGVLAELMPRLFEGKDLRNAFLVGTSSGAINAALWSFLADGQRTVREIGDAACDFWLRLGQPDIFRFRLRSLARVGRVTALLDTAPLLANAPRLLGLPNLTTPLSKGSVGALGVVATSCAFDASGGRSSVFLEFPYGAPHTRAGSSFDYVSTEVTLEHVLASAAIPLLFPAIEVTRPESARGFYVDGGVRLNAPISVALKLGAERIAVVSSHATRYPASPRPAEEQPDIIDVAAQTLHTVLADEMIEDLRALRRINALLLGAKSELICTADQAEFRKVELIEAAPEQNQLAQLAHDVLHSPAPTLEEKLVRLKYRAFVLALSGIGEGPGVNELLSYVFFDKEYAQAQIELGREEGKRAAARGWLL